MGIWLANYSKNNICLFFAEYRELKETIRNWKQQDTLLPFFWKNIHHMWRGFPHNFSVFHTILETPLSLSLSLSLSLMWYSFSMGSSSPWDLELSVVFSLGASLDEDSREACSMPWTFSWNLEATTNKLYQLSWMITNERARPACSSQHTKHTMTHAPHSSSGLL